MLFAAVALMLLFATDDFALMLVFALFRDALLLLLSLFLFVCFTSLVVLVLFFVLLT